MQCKVTYEEIVSFENLLAAWRDFVAGKRGKPDVRLFQARLLDNVSELHEELAAGTYRHGGYAAFNISDPKPRNIHKAVVRDRLVHHAIWRRLYPFFERTFLADSFSGQREKGIHRAMSRFRAFAAKVGRNQTRTVWVLKCDIWRFFASIDHGVLLRILTGYIPDRFVMGLLQEVIESFHAQPGKGLPLGNLTSQLFCNVYMNEFDHFVKHGLHVRYYLRYSDDFLLLSPVRRDLAQIVPALSDFLSAELRLALHPHKVFIRTLAAGVDFLGWVHFPHHRVLRTVTRRRMFRRIAQHTAPETLASYLGLLSHGDTFRLRRDVLNCYGLSTERTGEANERLRRRLPDSARSRSFPPRPG